MLNRDELLLLFQKVQRLSREHDWSYVDICRFIADISLVPFDKVWHECLDED